MITIDIKPEHIEFVDRYAPNQDIGGFSNLSSNDLGKASRLDFQRTGLYGELAFHLYHYKNLNKFKQILDYKFDVCKKNNIGDNGFDDCMIYNNEERFVDIKTSHCNDVDRIKYLNLIIPQREYHKNILYVCAFAIGKDRRNVERIVLAGWSPSENVHKRWSFDNSKLCVPVNDLKDMKDLIV